MVSGHSHRVVRGRPVMPMTRVGWLAVCLMGFGLLVVAPQEITGAEPVSTITGFGSAVIDAAWVISLYALFVPHDRAWLVLASLVGVVFVISPLLFIPGIVGAVSWG